MTEIRDRLLAAHGQGQRVSDGEAQRRLSLAIVDAVISTRLLSSVPKALAVQIREALEDGALTGDVAEPLTDSLHDYLVAKNNFWFVVKDREDKLIRALFEAVHPTVAEDGLSTVVADVEALIEGSATGFG